MSAIDWLTIENSFPTFLDNESPQTQIKKLQDYMFKLTDQLKYSLQNLDISNWNEAALAQFSKQTAAGMVDEVKKFAADLTRVQATASTLSSRISAISGRVTKTEEEISYLQDRMDTAEAGMQQLTEDTAALQQALEDTMQEQIATGEQVSGLQEQQDDLTQRVKAQENVVIPGEESDTIGKEGRTLNLVGTVYLNGVLLGTGGT